MFVLFGNHQIFYGGERKVIMPLECDWCGTDIDNGDYGSGHFTDDGDFLCDRCKEIYDMFGGKPICVRCGSEIDPEDFEENHVDEGGDPLCSDCYDIYTDDDWHCAECGKFIDPDDYDDNHVNESEARVCEECFSNILKEKIDEEIDLPTDIALDVSKPEKLDFTIDSVIQDLGNAMDGFRDLVNKPEVREWVAQRQTVRLLSVFCNTSGSDPYNMNPTIESCSATLKSSSDIGLLAAKLDSLNRKTANRNATKNIRFTKKLDNSGLRAQVRNNMGWSSDKDLIKKNPGLSNDVMPEIQKQVDKLVDILKGLAKEAGFPDAYISQIRVRYDGSGAHLQNNEWGVQDGTNIYYGPAVLHNGRLLATTIIHEFQHALDSYWKDEKSVPALRYRAALQFYEPNLPCPQGEDKCLEKEYIQYMSNLVERLADQAAYQLVEQLRDCYTSEEYMTMKNGLDFKLMLMQVFNTLKDLNKESFLFIDTLAQIVPELALMPVDFNMNLVQKPGKESIKVFIENENGWYFVGVESQNGNTYIVPTMRFLKELKEAVPGISLEPFFQKIWECISPYSSYESMPTYSEMIRMLYDASSFHSSGSRRSKVGKKAKSCISSPITADTFLFCYAFGELIKTYNSIRDTIRAAGFGDSLDDLADRIDELEDCMEVANELEDLCDELEDFCSEAETLQDELSDLASDYEHICDEYEFIFEHADDRSEELADEMREEYLNRVEDADSLDAVDSAKDDIKEEFEAQKEALKDEIEDELQNYADDIEDIESEIESLMGDLEALASDIEDLMNTIEDKSSELEEYEQLAEELEDVQDAIEKIEENSNADFSFECRVEVHVVDSDDKPVFGIPVTAIDPKSKTEFLLGFTDEEGYLDAAVDADQYYGWTVIANGKTLVYPSVNGPLYNSKEAVDQYFIVRIEDNEPVFVIESEFVLENAKQTSSGKSEQDSTLCVVMRGAKTKAARIPLGIGNIQAETVSWKDYYAYWFSGKEIKKDGKTTTNPVWQAMNAQNADYYGAYLIPLSSFGELPRTNGEIIFKPLYEYKNGAPSIMLRDSTVFSKKTDSNPVPFTSKAFDFGKVSPGRYELVIIMPIAEYSYHFSEITIGSGEDRVVRAEQWNNADDPTSRFIGENTATRYKTVELNSDLYWLDGSGNGSITDKKYGTLFALSVDAKGKALWSAVDCSQSGKLIVPAYYGWRDSGLASGSEGDHIEVCVGQIYLFFSKKPADIILYPVTYLCEYYEYRDDWHRYFGRKFNGFQPGRIYCETTSKSGTSQKMYVAFWEQFHDAEGNVHYRTYKKPVAFTLFWPIEHYFEDVFDDEIHMVDAVPEYVNGRMVNYLSQSKLQNKGASYIFEYTRHFKDINPSASYNQIASSYAAEPVTIKDSLWDTDEVEPGLKGIARMKCYIEDQNGIITKRYRDVEPMIQKDNEGVSVRFIVGSDAKVEKPKWDTDVPIITAGELYSINGRSNKIHKPSCGCCGLISKDNSIVARSGRKKAPKSLKTLKENLLLLGYTTCKRCKP